MNIEKNGKTIKVNLKPSDRKKANIYGTWNHGCTANLPFQLP